VSKTAKILLTSSVVLVILVLMIGMISVLIGQGSKSSQSPVYASQLIEAGSEFDPKIFLRDQNADFSILDGSVYDVNKPGDYTLTLLMDDGSQRRVVLKVRDTVPPSVLPLPVFLVKKGSSVLPEEFVPEAYVSDVSPVKVDFLSNKVVTDTEGLFSVSLLVKDESGNSVRAEASYRVTDAINEKYEHEIGGALPTVEDLLPGCSAQFKDPPTVPTVPGKAMATVKVFDGEFLLYYYAKDTVCPEGVLKEGPYNFFVGDSMPAPESFFEHITDATRVTVSYGKDYSLDKAEQKLLKLLLTDLGGNVTEYQVRISVFEKGEGVDEQPPVISGVRDIETTLGVEPDYFAGITVYDGRDGAISLDRVVLDTSAVKLNVISTGYGYPITYTVSDAAGNKVTLGAYVKVVRPGVSDEQLDACFDEVMSHLDTNGLSRFSVLSQVYNYVTGNYRFSLKNSANTDGSDYRVEAYWGFKLKSGNHETYTAMTAVILDRLGIEYYEVNRQKIGSEPHSWLLVDYGIGWLYMDCSPLEGFVWTKSGKLYRANDPEAALLPPSEKRNRAAMTDEDIKNLTALLNEYETGWNYYKVDLSGGLLPATATENGQGGYDSPYYTITYLVAGPNGKILGVATQSVKHGAKTSAVTAEAINPAYRFVKWSDGVTDATRSDVAMRNVTYTAEFEMYGMDKHTVTYQASEGGIVTGTLTQTKRYNETTSTVTARAQEGYYFVGWSDGVKTASRSDKVTADVTYTALFVPLVQIEYQAGEGGTVSGAAIQTLIPGEIGEIVTAVPQKGYLFVKWSDGLKTAQRRDTDTKTVKAIFEKDTASFTASYIAGEGGILEGTLTQTLVCWSKTTAVTAVPLAGYRFVAWSDGSTDAVRTDVVLEDFTATAIFEKLPVYLLKYEAGQGGSLIGPLEQSLYEGQIGDLVTAVPDEGYVFVGWDDGFPEPSRMDASEGEKTFVAVFKAKEPAFYTLTYTAGAGGRIEGAASQQVKPRELGSAVTAIPEEGYVFLGWSDGVVEATRADVALENLELEALFEAVGAQEL
jgi:hypothetical protein